MPLTAYRRKRHFTGTPEPEGRERKRPGKYLRFVVQKHWARRPHYDFRIEIGGVLKSWAVPKDIPVRSGERRLAVMTEDHPLDYRTFEGRIPEGNYGAGTVIVWDHGVYTATGSRSAAESERLLGEELRKGHLRVTLRGEELKGEYALIRLKDGRKWLLIKRHEEHEETGAELENPMVTPAPARRDLLEYVGTQRKGAVKVDIQGAVRAPMPGPVRPMLAVLYDQPFDRPGWYFEVKWDGYRALARTGGENSVLYSRTGKSLEERFPQIAASVRTIPYAAVFDGEIVALDEKGVSRFQLLQDYLKSGQGALVYYIFDLLYLNGYDLRSMPLSRRKAALRALSPEKDFVRLSDYVEEGGVSFYKVARENGAEGIIAKDAASPYRSGVRSDEWVKIKAVRRQEAVIGGFTEPRGAREYFGALVLGVYEQGELVYVGHAGGGFGEQDLAWLRRRFDPLVADVSPFDRPPHTNAPVTWLRPELVCEVKFSEWTRDGIMRQPVFLGLREDKDPRDVHRERAGHARTERDPGKETAGERSAGSAAVELSNLDKVFWPGERYTKGDLVDYYRAVAPVLLPYLKDRPENLHRFPDGINGDSFYQKNVDHMPPPWVTTEPLYSEADRKELRYLFCQDAASLLYVVNLGCIEINPWNSRRRHLDNPDFAVLDLDPLDISFDEVVVVAQEARKILEEAGVGSFCKTSGATGLHICIPLGARYTYEQAQEFSEAIVMLVNTRLPETTSVIRDPVRRTGKVYLDYRQNARGQTIAAPYSVRPRPGAPVSTPLSWNEVRRGLDPGRFTMKTIGKRLDKKGDLWRGVLGKGIDMERAIDCLQKAFVK